MIPPHKIGKKYRHRARRLAMQTLYHWHFNQNELSDLLETMLATRPAMKFDQDYFEHLVTGVLQNLTAIDALLQPALDRSLTELNPVELAILRVAAYEIRYQIEIPKSVVINEGVELAKEFGAEQGYKYVNAVLDKIATQCRPLKISDS